MLFLVCFFVVKAKHHIEGFLNIYKRKKLFVGTVPTNKKLSVGTVPTNKKLFVGTVPSNKKLFVGTVPTVNLLVVGTNFKENVSDMMNHSTDRVWACVCFFES